MERWVWFALDPAERPAGGEYAADDAALLHDILRGRGLEPLLVLPRTRWNEDLAGGPPGGAPARAHRRRNRAAASRRGA
jgi:hypothetical protein